MFRLPNKNIQNNCFNSRNFSAVIFFCVKTVLFAHSGKKVSVIINLQDMCPTYIIADG